MSEQLSTRSFLNSSKEEMRERLLRPWIKEDKPPTDYNYNTISGVFWDKSSFKLKDVLNMIAQEKGINLTITCWFPDVATGRFTIRKFLTYPEDVILYRDDNYRGIIHCVIDQFNENELHRKFCGYELPFQCRGDLRPIPTDDWLRWAYGGGTEKENAILLAAGLPPVVKPEPPKTGADRLLDD